MLEVEEVVVELTWRRQAAAASRTASLGWRRPEKTVSRSLREESVRREVVRVPSLEQRQPSWRRATTCRCWACTSPSSPTLPWRLLPRMPTSSLAAATCAFSLNIRPTRCDRMNVRQFLGVW